jgi:hypothetical protein
MERVIWRYWSKGSPYATIPLLGKSEWSIGSPESPNLALLVELAIIDVSLLRSPRQLSAIGKDGDPTVCNDLGMDGLLAA